MIYQIETGIITAVIVMPIALIILGIFYGYKFLFQKPFKFNIFDFFFKFSWLVITISILFITGVLTGNYNTTSIFTGNAVFNFTLFEQGLTSATILNFLLFIPFGFFLPLAFKKLPKKYFYGLLIGLAFSLAIEFSQTFTGRFVELEDLLMNSSGTLFGYIISNLLFNIKKKKTIFS